MMTVRHPMMWHVVFAAAAAPQVEVPKHGLNVFSGDDGQDHVKIRTFMPGRPYPWQGAAAVAVLNLRFPA